MSVRVLTGDVRDMLATLPDESVHCVVTSPPYWGLRDYGTGTWEGGDAGCPHEPIPGRGAGDNDAKHPNGGARSAAPARGGDPSRCLHCTARRIDRQLGMEPTMGEHIDIMVAVFREVRRVLRKDGTCWLNYGDCYAGSWGAQGHRETAATFRRNSIANHPKTASHTGTIRDSGLKPKDLCMIPNRLAMALQDDGWWVRSEIIWQKPNPMPESVTDRPATAHEKIWLLTRSARYFYDAEAVRRAAADSTLARWAQDIDSQEGSHRANGGAKSNGPMKAVGGIKRKRPGGGPNHQFIPGENTCGVSEGGANLRNVWTIPTKGFSGAHYATFPPDLIVPCIKAGTSEKGCCAECGAPWVRETEVDGIADTIPSGKLTSGRHPFPPAHKAPKKTTTGWSPSCPCDADTIPCTVLDPFIGSGTTAMVADRLGRDCVGIDLNPANVEMATERITQDAGMFAEVGAE